MKITNRQLVNFMNAAGGILQKRIPRKLFSAIDLNVKTMVPIAETYNKQLQKCDQENDVQAANELLAIEVEAVIQTVSEEVFDHMDESDKFDSLSGTEYSALQFMITQ